jgi:hypothetical protein
MILHYLYGFKKVREHSVYMFLNKLKNSVIWIIL